jgi:pimeloyl-ACP methyl ester carboxylesterase
MKRIFRFSYAVVIFAILAAAHASAPPSKFATVNGARLEYLDWGGSGPPLLFLAGMGSTAHIFEDLAPEFKSNHRCLALTRRGFGRSEQTAGGYDLDDLAHDIFAFATQLGLRDVTLIGHSYGGTEAIRVAQLFPELVRRVILLDTAYDTIPPDAPAAEAELYAAFTRMSDSDRLSSLEHDRAWEKRLLGNVWSNAAESDLGETVVIANDGSVQSRTPGRISAAIVSERAKGKWHITSIPVPALLIFANNAWTEMLAGLDLNTRQIAEITKAWADLDAARRSQIEAFRRDSPKAEIVELDHTVHHCFIQRKERVVEEIRPFLQRTF